MFGYAPELWELFGVTVFTVWDLDLLEFLSLVDYIDTARRERAAAREKEEADGR